jgi:hypothetical protein
MAYGGRTCGYDNLNRRKTVTPTGYIGYPSRSYDLDYVGNPSVMTNGSSTQLQRQQFKPVHIGGATTLGYESRGNLASDGSGRTAYDDNLLTRVTIGGTTSSVRHIYDEQWNVLCDIDASSGAILDEVRPRTAVPTTDNHENGSDSG